METTGAHILIVDDDPDCREALCEFLELQGYAVAVAEDGIAALEALRGMSSLPDVALVDLKMPRMDGEELIDAIRRDRRLGAVTLIAMTAAIERPRPPGAVALIAKPFSSDALLGAIGDVLAAARVRAACGSR